MGTKTCTKCGAEKPATSEYFYRSKLYRDGLRSMCKTCCNAWPRNTAKDKERYWKVKTENIKILQNAGLARCSVCGYDKCFDALDFHHTNPKQKEHHNDAMSRWLYLKTESFLEKIQKNNLKVLCANCHRELHAVRMGAA